MEGPRALNYGVWSELEEAAGPGPDEYVCSGELGRISPGLEVDGIAGLLCLPLAGDQAAALRARCRPASYGLGEQTLVDPAVRNTLQLEPSEFRITNPEWEAQVVREAVRRTAEAMDIETEVEARLYKLLYYEQGGHFKPHRDTEKEEGMWGSLVILLPSHYTGGQLVVRHAGLEETVDLAAANAQATCFEAFYADCEHEVLPVTSGCRLALVYNLISPPTDQPYYSAAPDPAAVQRLVALSQQWGADPSAPRCLCYVFDHQYSEASLRRGLGALKGADRSAAQLLLAACQAGADLDVSVAHVTCMAAEFPEQQGREEEQPADDEMQPERWGTIRAAKFTMLVGPAPAFSSITLRAPDELAQDEWFWEELWPDKAAAQFQGNEGTYELFWYRRAGLVVIPTSNRLANTIRFEPTRQVLRLYRLLRPDGQPLPADDPAAGCLERLERQQQHASRSAAEIQQAWADDEWGGGALLDGYHSSG